MKDEELGPDRGFVFETDEEENVGEDDYDCDVSDSSEYELPSCDSLWPQSYRQSIDILSSVTPPQAGSVVATSLNSRISSSWSFHKPATFSPEIVSPLISKSTEPDKSTPSHLTLQSASSYPSHSDHELLPSSQCSYGQSLLNGINILCGVGLLSTPYAVKEGGWLGLSILFGFALMSCYTGILLKRCLESKPGIHTYPDIGQAAFGNVGRLGISIILYAELYGACVEFIILISDNLTYLFPNAHLNLVGFQLIPHQLFAIVATLVVLPTVWLRDLSFLSYLSAGGVIASILVAICLLWVGLVDQVPFHPSGTLLDLKNLPVAIGLYGFCYSGHAVFPNIYSSMEKPAQFPVVLIGSFLVCTVLYAGVAVIGFMMFGNSIKSQFTLNMPQQFLASKTAVWTMVVNPLTKYALTINPIAMSLEELLPQNSLKSNCISMILRTILVTSTLVVALTIPFFGYVMAFIGSFLAMIVAVIFPCAAYLTILRGRVPRVQVIACVLIIVVGVTCCCVGSYSAIAKIAKRM